MSAEPALGSALARLESRWGSAAVRVGVGVADEEDSAPVPGDDVVPTGFARLDALLGPGGLPRGAIVAFLDLCRIFDPLEAQARGVDLRWLLICRPHDIDEGWALAAALVSGRQVDLLVIDLPENIRAGNDAALRRLAAHARRAGVRLIVLEPVRVAASVHGALAESVGLRLE